MKKSLLLLACSFVLINLSAQDLNLQVGTATANKPHFTAPAQNNAVSNLDDTLMYFYNKHLFRNVWNGTNSSPNLLFYTIPAPYSTTANISHCGSVFRNTGTVTVTGAQGLVMRRPSAPSASVDIKLYICSTNLFLVPQMPPIDSAVATISNSTAGDWVGGNFTNPVTVTGNFAILFRNGSTNTNDTVRLFLNNAATLNSTVSAEQKFGEGLGVMRINGNFQTTQSAFGGGGDYEFIVAPRVQIGFTASVTPQTSTLCANSQAGFLNSTINQNVVENRMFNFNAFYKHWSPWATQTNSLILLTQPDSVYQWIFSGSSTPPLYTKHASAIFNTTGVQSASLTAFYQVTHSQIPPSISITDGNTGTLTVSSAFAPTLVVSGNSVLCAGGSTTLTATGNTTFTWFPGNHSGASYVVNPTSNTVYTVTGASSGCTGITLYSVNVTSPPNVVVTGPNSVCEGKSFTLSASGASSYTWSNGAQTPSVILSTTVTGINTYTATGVNGNCPPVSTVKNINVETKPEVFLDAEVNALCTKATGGTTMALYGSPEGGRYTGTGVTSQGIFNPNSKGTFTATYTYTDQTTGCAASTTMSILVGDCTGLEQETSTSSVMLYPNPASNGLFTVSNLTAGSVIEIYNVAGSLVRRQEVTRSEYQADLGNQPAGIYLVKIRSGASERTIRLVNGN